MRLVHPRHHRLTAWYDQELDDPALTAHISACDRCGRRVQEMARVDAAVRGEGHLAPAHPAPAHVRLSPAAFVARPRVAAIAAAAVVVALLGLTVPERGTLHAPLAAAYHSLAGGKPATTPSRETAVAPTSTTAPAAPGGVHVRPTTTSVALAPHVQSPVPSRAPVRPPDGPFRIATIVPATGPLAPEGTEVARAVRAAVDGLNAGGGVGGQPIQLTVIHAEDVRAGRADLRGIRAIAGGFGVDATSLGDVPWLFPADAAAGGPLVVAVDPSPSSVGASLGREVAARSSRQLVGVVVGGGPDAALAAGLQSMAQTTTVTADSSSTCAREVATLRGRGVTALAVAGSPELASRCADAAAGWGWRDGLLVAPSAAYGGQAPPRLSAGSVTVLGLPWPTADEAGPRRYRSLGLSPTSYRAEVSFAAVELAVQVVRESGVVSIDTIAAGTWTSDLYQLTGITNSGARLVRNAAGQWQSP